MKIVDAIWEKRNLGVSTQEIVVENADSLEEFRKIVEALDSSYAVIKIPINKIDFFSCAEDNGFRFIENQFIMLGSVNQIVLEADKLLKRNRFFSVETDNSPQMYDFVASKINEGVFRSDRIAVDPFFGETVANKRYANWLLDMKNNEKAHLQIMKQAGNIVGFNLNKNDGQCSHGLIGGLFREFQAGPIGIYWGAGILKNISLMKNILFWEATVSSNNLYAIKMWEHFGMHISSAFVVFTRHR